VEVNFRNQALTADDIPPKVHYCWQPIFVELGNKLQPASPLSLSVLSKASIRFDPQTLTAPSMHTFMIYNGMSNDTISKISMDPSHLSKTLYGSIHENVTGHGECTMESQINTIYSKIAFINHYIDKKIIKNRNFLIDIRIPSKSNEMSLGEMELDRNLIGVILPELEDLISEIKISHRTPRSYIQRIIGLGGSRAKRLTNMSTVAGYKGIYVHIDNPELILQNRPQKTAMMGAFCQVLRMLPNFEKKKLTELDLIKASFIIDSLLAMGIDITSIHDIIQILPLWNKWRMTPSIFGLRNKDEICKFFLQMYVLGRYISMVRASGIDTLIRETSWEFTGNNLPTNNILENCFQGLYRGDVSGLRQYWAWPAASSDLRSGYLQIMSHDISNKNFWYLTPEPNELKIRSSPVFVEYEYIIMPDLLDEGYDAAILCLEPSAKTAERRELYHKEAYPPTTLIQGRFIDSKCVASDLLETILTAGQPLYGGNLLYRPYNEQYAPTEGTTGRILDLEDVKRARQLVIDNQDRWEDEARAISSEMYRGAVGPVVEASRMQTLPLPTDHPYYKKRKELNEQYYDRGFYCPICDKYFARLQDLKTHNTKYHPVMGGKHD
jgi:hypothetical protein